MPASVVGQTNVMGVGTVWLYASPEGDVSLYDRPAATSYPLVVKDHVLSHSEQKEQAFQGMKWWDGVPYQGFPTSVIRTGPTPEQVEITGAFLGVDGKGRIYTLSLENDERLYLRMYASDGQLKTRGAIPHRDFDKTMVGKERMLVSPLGGVYECVPTKGALIVSHWTPEEN